MNKLPLELIEKILSNKVLSIEDVVNFSSTCHHYRSSVLSSSVIWRHKFQDNYSRFLHLFENTHGDFFEEIRYIYELKQRTMALLETMPSRFHTKYLLSEVDLEEWDNLMKERKETYYYLISSLTEIISVNEPIKSIEAVPLNTPGNKTLQYYARKVQLFIKQQHLAQVWEDFKRLPPKKQLLEKAASFVAEWCQADTALNEENIVDNLNYIANMVKDRLFAMNPDHEIFKTKKTHLEKWKTENLDENQWKAPECRQVLTAMRQVFYNDLGFCGHRENYYQSDNSLINKVIEYRTGLPIILAIIYESIGRRLGLLFEPINFPAHFLIRYTEVDKSKQSVYYIDTFNDGAVIEKPGCPMRSRVQHEELFPVASAPQVVERIVNNLELSTRQHIEPNGRDTFLRSILELQLLINPLSFECVINLARFYISHKVNTKKLDVYSDTQLEVPNNLPADLVETMISRIEDASRETLHFQLKSVQLKRNPEVKYAVGMIMTIVDNAEEQKCVISGWNTELWSGCCFMAPAEKRKRRRQPFYNILVEDGTSRYVSQDSLTPCSSVGKLLQHTELGRYFSHFFVNHFVPNAEKEQEYMEDKKVRQKYYHNSQLNQYTL